MMTNDQFKWVHSFILWFLDYTYQNLLVQKEEKKLKYFNFDSEDQRQEVLSAHGLGSCSAYRSKHIHLYVMTPVDRSGWNILNTFQSVDIM